MFRTSHRSQPSPWDKSCYGVVATTCLALFGLAGCARDVSLVKEEATAPTQATQIAIDRGDLTAFDVSADGKQLVIGSSSGIFMYDAATFEQRWAHAYSEPILDLSFSSDGEQLIACHSTNKISVWESNDGNPLSVWAAPDNIEITRAEFSSDGRFILGDVFSRRLPNWGIIWAASDGKLSYELDAYISDSSIARNLIEVNWVDTTTPLVASAYSDTLTIYDAETKKLIREFHTSRAIDEIAWSPNGKWLAVGSGDAFSITIWASSDWSVVSTLSLPHVTGLSNLSSLEWSPDGGRIAAGLRSGTVLVWDTESGQMLYTLGAHEDEAFLHWSSDAQTLFSWSWDDKIIKWDAKTGEPIRELEWK